MIQRIFRIVALAAAIFASAGFGIADETPKVDAKAFKFEPREEKFKSPVDGTMQTYLVAEWGQDKPAEHPVLVLYLHGSGSHQDQGMKSDVYFDTFGKMGRWMSARRAVYICPEYRGSTWMGPAAEGDVVEIIRLARERYKPSAVLLTGGSMGGTSALIFASLHPDLLTGVLAWCPATDPVPMYPRFAQQFDAGYGGSPEKMPVVYRERTSRDHADALAKLPVAIAHGSADNVIPVDHSRILVERLRERKAKVKYVEIENGDHDAAFKADVVELLDWLMASVSEQKK